VDDSKTGYLYEMLVQWDRSREPFYLEEFVAWLKTVGAPKWITYGNLKRVAAYFVMLRKSGRVVQENGRWRLV